MSWLVLINAFTNLLLFEEQKYYIVTSKIFKIYCKGKLQPLWNGVISSLQMLELSSDSGAVGLSEICLD